MIAPLPICAVCRHYLHRDAACTVYPDGIPEALWSHRADHRQPFAGDGGVQFEADPTLPPETVADRLAFEEELQRRLAPILAQAPSR